MGKVVRAQNVTTPKFSISILDDASIGKPYELIGCMCTPQVHIHITSHRTALVQILLYKKKKRSRIKYNKDAR